MGEDKTPSSNNHNDGGGGRGGIRFGAGGTYDDDAMALDVGDDPGYVKELPTTEEERRMVTGDMRAREETEEVDEGRVSYHPSTSKKHQVCTRSFVLVIF